MKKKSLLWLNALLLMFGSCSTNESITESVLLSNVSHTECENHSLRTRANDNPYASRLKLT